MSIERPVFRSFFKSFRRLVKPKSRDEDLARREYILNILLGGAIFLSVMATFLSYVYHINALHTPEGPQGAPFEIVAFVSLSFLVLYFFSRAGFHRISAYLLIGVSLFSAIYTSYNWGVDIPQAVLTYSLVIVMSGILVGTRFAFIVTIVSSVALLVIANLQIGGLIQPNFFWRQQQPYLADIVVISATLTVIAVVSWLSNREIEQSLKRARRSETALKKERDLLEVKVEERTRELKQAQLEKMLQLYHFAKFGRLASGLFHDLANPLTNVHLNLERLSAQETSSLLKRALGGVKQMENFVEVARKQIQEQETETSFSAPDEIKQVIQMFAHRAKEEKVEIRFQQADSFKIYGNPLKFYQLITNLLSNAIDAYKKTERDKRKRQVLIELKRVNGKIRLAVQDWGCGIPKEQLGKIFDPFFTTKSADKGTGIGLCICKDIVEKDFGGRIKVKSRKGKGSTLTAELPIKQSER